MKSIFKFELLVSFSLIFYQNICISQAVTRTMSKLPDSGQNQSFSTTYGEDADYQINVPYFLLNADGTVTDTVTGLMWQQVDGGEMTFERATEYCTNLRLGGYSDWRLPSAQEAFSILNHGRQNPPLDLKIFPISGAEYWWTGELQKGSTTKVWVTNAGGGIGNHPKNETISAGGIKKIHVRAVRDIHGPQEISAHFIISDSIVTDVLTGLEWQRFGISDFMEWEEALRRAENLVLQGYTDWRLPNIKELESINDEDRLQPSVQEYYFPEVGINKYWSSTSLPNQTNEGWFMHTEFGVISHESKATKNKILCVRGGINPILKNENIAENVPLQVFSNVFSQFIHTTFRSNNIDFHLIDSRGISIYRGKNIDAQDFSSLSSGVYYLITTGDENKSFKLIKI